MERLSPHAQISSSSRRRLARWLVGLPISVVERDLILETLACNHGNRTVSARLLGVSVRTLRNKIAKYSAEGFHIPSHESRDKILRPETMVHTNTRPKDKAAAMPVALAGMRRGGNPSFRLTGDFRFAAHCHPSRASVKSEKLPDITGEPHEGLANEGGID